MPRRSQPENRAMYGHPMMTTKAARTCQALRAAGRKAELQHDWDSAAEFYEAAAAVNPGAGVQAQRDIDGLLRKAAECRGRMEA